MNTPNNELRKIIIIAFLEFSVFFVVYIFKCLKKNVL